MAEQAQLSPLKAQGSGADKKRGSALMWLGCLLLVIAASLHSADKPIGGGDTWVAMACGRYTLGAWALEQEGRTVQMKLLDLFGIHMTKRDPFGANSRPYIPEDSTGRYFGWVNQNWLTHVVFYRMKTWWGENSIVVYKFLQAVLTGLLAYWAGRVMGAHPILAAGAAAFGMLLSRSFIDLRPNQSSILFAAALILILAYWRQGKVRALYALLPVLILWSNVHGGFIYAIMIMMIVLASYAIHHYLGRSTYVFLILGFIVAAFMLLSGAGGLGEELDKIADNVEKLQLAGRAQDAQTLNEQLTEIKDNYAPWRVAGYLSAIVSLAIAVGVGLRMKRLGGNVIYRPKRRSLVMLAGAAGATWLVPAIFSPFGLENLLHPLVVAAGKEGQKWRSVIEWRPIWDGLGFGNEGPYCYFLTIGALLFVLWWVLYLLKPTSAVDETSHRSRKTDSQPDDCPWPQIDLAYIGIMGITLIMSIKSRRFIFLGGVVLAPFIAKIAQDIINMVRVLMRARQKKELVLNPMGPKLKSALALTSLVGTALIGWVFANGINEIYYKPAYDGYKLSMFRRMVGITAQPVEAIRFFDLNHLQGTVFNGWVNGGFIAFGQHPNEKGEPACKAYIDGRAQAAYELSHFEHWQNLKGGRDDNRRALSAQQYDETLQREGVNVALLNVMKSEPNLRLLEQSGNWETVYIDSTFAIMLRKNASSNQKLFEALDSGKLNYPDEMSEKMSRGFYWCHSGNGNLRRQGFDLLKGLELDHYCQMIYGAVFRAGMTLGLKNEVEDYFEAEYKKMKELIDSGERFALTDNISRIRFSLSQLGALADRAGDKKLQAFYEEEQEHYGQLQKDLRLELTEGMWW